MSDSSNLSVILQSSTCLLHGSMSVIGRRKAMEDTVTVEPGIIAGEFAFFAVYDGHGGSRVAKACRDHLHEFLAMEIEAQKSPEKRGGGDRGIDWEKVMVDSFAKMDEEVNQKRSLVRDENEAQCSSNTTGSTAVVVLVGKEELVVANCGDSRAIISSGGIAVPLSHDHKPDRDDERQRVEAAGGVVVNWHGWRVLGVLSTSRSIGDPSMKPYVICKPEVTVKKQTESDEFVIIGSDGMWNFVSNEEACKVVRVCLSEKYKRLSKKRCVVKAAINLTKLADTKGSEDNISTIVVKL